MQITGKIILELPERSGISARSGNEWRLKSFVLETVEQYPKKMQFEIFGLDRINAMNIQVGEVYTIDFDIDAHEYQGRWYNSIRAFRAMPPQAAGAGIPEQPSDSFAAQPTQQVQMGAPLYTPQPNPTTPSPSAETSDDLPF
ncbi:MAG: DUF3127 domain-containing protein [Bacteroidaceae bacterium]|mgnify:FL=1|nr:DUF3127 domain-containing protein [Bacteroidaceae bacterium]